MLRVVIARPMTTNPAHREMDKPMTGTLVPILYSGLGNRIRVMLSAESLAAELKMNFAYAWQIDHRFQAQPDELWSFDAARRSTWSSVAASRILGTSKTSESVVQHSGRPVVYVRTQQPLVLGPTSETWEQRFKRLRPSETIRKQSSDVWRADLSDGPYIGVMVRAHPQSHPKTKEASPVEWFIDRMRELSAQQRGIKFFLSCDYPPAQERILKEVDNVVTVSKKARYNSPGGVVEAVNDLYLLSGASHLLGPHWSSFYDMAVALQGSTSTAETSRNGTRVSISQTPLSDAHDGALRSWQTS
jgi:hypothetical protein